MRVVGEQDRALRFGIPAACRNIDHGSAIGILRSVADRTHSMRKVSSVIAELDPAIHLHEK
jgi:hypothetical protein